MRREPQHTAPGGRDETAARAHRSGGTIRSLTAALAAILILAGCGEETTRAATPRPALEQGRIVFPPGSPQIAAITTEAAADGEPIALRLPGRLVWDEERTVRIYTVFAGRVTAILARPGDAVHAGQPLARVASPDFGQVQAEARRAAADLALAEKNFVRARELVANGVAPQKELNAAEAEHVRARAESARALERVKLYGAGDAVDSALALRSPIAGVIVERNINPGQELRTENAGGPPLFVVTDPTRLWVHLDAAERDVGYLGPGERIELAVAAYPGEQFEALVVAVADFVDPATRTIRVRGIVVNPARRLKGDMYVAGLVRTDVRPVVQVPARSVFLIGEQQYVFVEEAPGRYRRVEVATSSEAGGRIGIEQGLRPGERVVVEGSLFLQRIYAQLTARERAEKG